MLSFPSIYHNRKRNCNPLNPVSPVPPRRKKHCKKRLGQIKGQNKNCFTIQIDMHQFIEAVSHYFSQNDVTWYQMKEIIANSKSIFQNQYEPNSSTEKSSSCSNANNTASFESLASTKSNFPDKCKSYSSIDQFPSTSNANRTASTQSLASTDLSFPNECKPDSSADKSSGISNTRNAHSTESLPSTYSNFQDRYEPNSTINKPTSASCIRSIVSALPLTFTDTDSDYENKTRKNIDILVQNSVRVDEILGTEDKEILVDVVTGILRSSVYSNIIKLKLMDELFPLSESLRLGNFFK